VFPRRPIRICLPTKLRLIVNYCMVVKSCGFWHVFYMMRMGRIHVFRGMTKLMQTAETQRSVRSSQPDISFLETYTVRQNQLEAIILTETGCTSKEAAEQDISGLLDRMRTDEDGQVTTNDISWKYVNDDRNVSWTLVSISDTWNPDDMILSSYEAVTAKFGISVLDWIKS